MNDITSKIQNLRLNSEQNRQSRASARTGQNAARAQSPAQGSGGSPKATAAPDPKGGKQSKAKPKQSASGHVRRDSSGGPLRSLAKKLNLSDALKNKTFSLHYAEKHEHPYDREPEEMPVAYGTPAKLTSGHSDVHMEPVQTPYGPGVKMRGREFLSVVSSGAQTYDSGSAIIALPLNPRILMLPRMSIMAKLFTRFIFNKFTLCYNKSAGTQNNGSLQMFGVYDPTINPTVRPGETLIAYAAQRGATDLSLYQDAYLQMDDSHFKDLLFLEPDDDLRWTMQGVVFVTASGAIASSLECGKVMLEYEVTFANDDLEDEGLLTARNFRDITATIAITTDGARSEWSLPVGAVPNGKYFITFRTAPTNPVTLWKDVDASITGNLVQKFTTQKGFGCYAIVASNLMRLCYGPDLFAEDASSPSFTKLMFNGNAITAGTNMKVDFYRYTD
jgi:hypothetical protein